MLRTRAANEPRRAPRLRPEALGQPMGAAVVAADPLDHFAAQDSGGMNRAAGVLMGER